MEQVHIRVLDPAVDAERDHILGPADAPVTLVEYGDFECPFCARSYPAVQAIRRQLGDRLFGLEVGRFEHDLTTHVYLERVHADLESAVRGGAHGTPTFFINGVKHEGADR